MNADMQERLRLERLLAYVLHYGTWLGSVVIAAGLVQAACPRGASLHGLPSGMRVVAAGVALFILLPVIRVIAMFAVFLRQRDYRFGAIAALVLGIILLGFVLGMR